MSPDVGHQATPPGSLIRASFWNDVVDVDDWLDSDTAAAYDQQPLAQHWARVAKVNEEAGEAIEALIAWTGQNPRKPQRDEAREELLTELADVALTALLAIQHFTKDSATTSIIVERRMTRLWNRMSGD